MRTPFQEVIATELLLELERKSQTITELAANVGRNYYTVRNVVHSLIAEGTVMRADNSFRNGKVRLVDADSPTAIIPTVEVRDGKYHKLTDLLNLRFNPNPDAAKAVHHLPRHITRLLNAALLQAAGNTQERTLKLLKSDMTRDLEALEAMVRVYKQIIDNPVNWNTAAIARYVTDPSLDKRALQDSYDHFFKAGNTND